MAAWNKKDLTGQKFGKLTVIKEAHRENKCSNARWTCKCECGEYTEVAGNKLTSGHTKSCGCLRRKRAHNWKGHGDISMTYFTIMHKNAEARGYKFDVTVEQIWNLFLEQNKKCALSGMDIELVSNYSGKKKNNQTASLDRIDSSKGYTIDNVQWVHKDINKIKVDLDEDYFKLLCRKVTEHENLDSE